MYVVTTYRGQPAILDTRARVYYTCATVAAARARAAELNSADRKGALL